MRHIDVYIHMQKQHAAAVCIQWHRVISREERKHEDADAHQ